jgi:glutathione S-transferase
VLELYHTVNSVCAQKVRIQLEEKGLPWAGKLMSLRGDQFDPAYLKLNPNGVVPTLVHDGFAVMESSVILYYLEECFPEPSLMPASPQARVAVRLFNKLIDESVHNACTVLTFATALRPRFQRMKAQARERYLRNAPSKQRAEYKRDVIQHGLDSRYVADAVRHHEKLIVQIARALAHDRYLAGPDLSLADIAVIPYVKRLDLLGLSGLWHVTEGVQAWYDRVHARPAVQRAIVNCMTDDDLALFRDFETDPWPVVSDMLETREQPKAVAGFDSEDRLK